MARSILLALVLAVASCTALPAQEGGTGPLTISPTVAAGYEQFRKLPDRYFFAVSKDGEVYGYSFCREFGGCIRWGGRKVAVESCEKASRGVPCYIYANMSGVLWKGKVTIAESASDRLSNTAPPIPPERPSRPVTLIKCRLPDGFVISMVPERCKLVGGAPE